MQTSLNTIGFAPEHLMHFILETHKSQFVKTLLQYEHTLLLGFD